MTVSSYRERVESEQPGLKDDVSLPDNTGFKVIRSDTGAAAGGRKFKLTGIKYWLIVLPVILLLGCGNKAGKTVATGPGGMSVDNKGAIHDNRGNTYEAPTSPEMTEKELLVPLYPGSKDDGSDVEDQGSRQTFISSRITTDSVQQVVDFYKPKLPNLTQTTLADHALLGGTFPKGKVTIAINKEDRGTTIGISTTADK